MRGSDFKKRALHEGLRYGEDRMVFLRELAQNSRDAGAREIRVTTKLENGQFALTFEDDGAGMGYDHARSYLFTLYASSKEDETTSAGRFGVGFWSVLLFRPSAIEIDSCAVGQTPWKVVLDGDLSRPRLAAGSVAAHGTRIAIRRVVESAGEAERLRGKAERALKRYCRYLRQNDKDATPLPIEFNGQPINQPFALKGPCWMTFQNSTVEGAVGLGERPRIDLYARGLLVWRGTVLDELKYGAAPTRAPRHPQGLAPVYALGGNELNVTLDRRSVVDDRALNRVRNAARKRMRELLWSYLDGLSPRPLWQRFADRLSGLSEDVQKSGRLPGLIAVAVALFVLGGCIFAVFNWFENDARLEENPTTVNGAIRHPGGSGVSAKDLPIAFAPRKVPLSGPLPFYGPAVDPVLPSEQVALSYRPSTPLKLRIAAYEQLHAGLGMTGGAVRIASSAPAFRCVSGCVEVEVEISAVSGAFVLPVPTGHRVDPGSVSMSNHPLTQLRLSEMGEPTLRFDGAAQGALKYRTGPASTELKSPHRERLLALPPLMKLPAELKRFIAETAKLETTTQRIAALTGLVKKHLLYDQSATTAQAYTQFLTKSPRAGWLDFVFTFGRGDCDVKNTALVVLLRRIGVPARLAIGVVGQGGRARPGMHAWVEYYDDSWREADATGGTEETRVVSPEGPLESIPNQVPRRLEPTLQAPPEQGQWSSSNPWLRKAALVAGGVALTAAVIALLLLFTGQTRREIFAEGDRERHRAVAAEMVTNALTHPEAWLKGGGVAQRRLLPLHGSREGISLSEALERGPKGRLWHSNGEPAIVRRAVARGAKILDSSDAAFGALIRRLPAIIDLDETARLSPTRPEKLSDDLEPVARLITRMNRLLERAGLPRDLIVPCPGLNGSFSRDVELNGLGMARNSSWPAWFIAVQPRAESITQRAMLGQTDASLAAFLGLDLLVENSDLLRPHREQIMLTAAKDTVQKHRRGTWS